VFCLGFIGYMRADGLTELAYVWPRPGAITVRDPSLRVVFTNSPTFVVLTNSIRIFLDETPQTSLSITQSDGQIVVTCQQRPRFLEGELHTSKVVWSDDQFPPLSKEYIWSFRVGPLTSDTLFIEAEDFNYSNDGANGGLYANSGDPDCSLLGKDAVLGVDYFESGNTNAPQAYRAPTGVETTNFSSDLLRSERTNTCDHIVHANEPGDWYNYTRYFGPRASHYYGVYLRASSVGGGSVRLDEVVGAGTSNQTATNRGIFQVPDTGGEAIFDLIPLTDAAGYRASLEPCGLRTFRLTHVSGNVDLNYFAFTRLGPRESPIRVAYIEPAANSYARGPVVKAEIWNGDQLVVRDSLRIYIDCFDRTASATISNVSDRLLISAQAPPYSPVGTPHTVQVRWLETSDCGLRLESNYYVWAYLEGIYNPDANLFIEAEDFDTGGGRAIPSFNEVPFNAKGQYQGLGAVAGTDYNHVDSGNINEYRLGEDPNVSMIAVDERVDTRERPRPGFEIVTDYKIGWNTSGHWYNYTRNWPRGLYHVYLRASHGHESERITADLTLIRTNGPATKLGTFSAPPTGGWDAFTFVPLLTEFGNQAVVLLQGPATLRLNSQSGADLNYLMFVDQSTHVDYPPIYLLKCDLDGLIYLGFRGYLESAPSIQGPWSPEPNLTSPAILPLSTVKQKFWRMGE
jgi:hypothetical protein